MAEIDLEHPEVKAQLEEIEEYTSKALTEDGFLDKLLQVVNYNYGDARVVAKLSPESDLSLGSLVMTYTIEFTDAHPDMFQVAQRMIILNLLRIYMSPEK